MMRDTKRLSIGFVLVICGIIAAILVLSGCSDTYRGAEDARFDHSDAWSEDGWAFATVTDTETGVVYLVFKDNNGNTGVGGITPLLRRDGSVTIDDSIGVRP